MFVWDHELADNQMVAIKGFSESKEDDNWCRSHDKNVLYSIKETYFSLSRTLLPNITISPNTG